MTLRAGERDFVVELCSAASEVGQGISTVQVQIAQAELAVASVVLPADTTVGSAGSSSGPGRPR